MQTKILLALIISISHWNFIYSQTNWDLKRSVEYALANNITVKQADISSQQAELDFRQNRFGQYPNASLSNNWGLSFGRRENPTTGIFENTNSLYSSFNFSSSISIFNFFSMRNTIAASKYELAAYKALETKARNDIALRVANAYLLALQAKEQVEISELQINLTNEQL